MRLDASVFVPEAGKQEPQYQIWLCHDGPYSANATVHVLDNKVLSQPSSALNVSRCLQSHLQVGMSYTPST